jgi:hypothetical protein
VITDADHRSRIPARLLNAELTCPICLSIVRQTHTFMECLHRFCQECIEKVCLLIHTLNLSLSLSYVCGGLAPLLLRVL